MCIFSVIQVTIIISKGSQESLLTPLRETELWLQATVDVFLATQLAIDYGIKFLETSAKSSINVEEVRKWRTLLTLIE